MPQQYTFDRSSELGLALVATTDMRQPHYQPLASAPADLRDADQVYLRQLHTVANGVMTGLIAHQGQPLVPAQWERLGTK